MRNGILLFLIFCLAPAQSFAKLDECEGNLTIDQRYVEARQSDLSDKEKRVAYTHLLNEAITPLLKTIHSQVLQLSPEKVKEFSKTFSVSNGAHLEGSMNFYIDKYQLSKGLDEGYSGFIYALVKPSQKFDLDPIGYTPSNLQVLKRLYAASLIVGSFVQDNIDFDKIKSLGQSRKLLLDRSFTKNSYHHLLSLAYLSVLQSAAQLTSEPVGDLSMDELLKEVMSPHGKIPSLVVLHSLMLPPAFLGPYGSKIFMKGSLIASDQCGVTFSPKFRNALKKNREKWAEGIPTVNEFGSGCPVGHVLNASEPPSLQYFLDAIMHVYGALE